MLTINIMGKSGAGKGTQIKLLLEYLKGKDIIYAETGKMFREFIQGTSFAAQRSLEIMRTGKRQPDYLAVLMWGVFFKENIKTGKENILIDGFPRSYPEAKMVETFLDHYERQKMIVIILDVSDEEATERMFRRGRQDDNEKDIKVRLGWFKKDVIPAINFFRKKDRYEVVKINGESNPEEVHKAIVSSLGL